jgi:glutathione S-transferase
VPHELNSPAFVKDRQTIYPFLARSDFTTLRESGIADLYSRLDYLENVALADSAYIGGDRLSVADIHAIWGVRWDLHGLESNPPGLGAKESILGKEEFPKVWRLLESLPLPQPKMISFEEAKAKIFGSEYFSKAESVWEKEPTGIKAGTEVTVDSLG